MLPVGRRWREEAAGVVAGDGGTQRRHFRQVVGQDGFFRVDPRQRRRGGRNELAQRSDGLVASGEALRRSGVAGRVGRVAAGQRLARQVLGWIRNVGHGHLCGVVARVVGCRVRGGVVAAG